MLAVATTGINCVAATELIFLKFRRRSPRKQAQKIVVARRGERGAEVINPPAWPRPAPCAQSASAAAREGGRLQRSHAQDLAKLRGRHRHDGQTRKPDELHLF